MTPKKLLPPLNSRAIRVEKNKKKVYTYLKRKLSYKRRSKNVPLLITMLTIAKAKGLSYSQVRYALNELLLEGKIEKWTVSDRPMHSATYYRIVDTSVPRAM